MGVIADGAQGSQPAERWARFQRPGAWLWLALTLGAAVRLYLVLATEGTYDVSIWRQHASGVANLGLIDYYQRGHKFNHPPLAGLGMAGLWEISAATGAPFRILLRAPFALLDLGTALLMLRVLRASPWRYALTAGFWLCPLSFVYSSFHGNTDTAVAFFTLLAVTLVASARPGWAGAALGAGLAVKLPGILAAPALVFALPGWTARVRFLTATAVVVALGYSPGLLQDAPVVLQHVFGYRGQNIQTTGGVQVWGIQNFYPLLFELPYAWHAQIRAVTTAYYGLNTPVCFGLISVFAFARRRARTAPDLAATIGVCFVIFYGFTNYWSFQYFAWSLPFLLCLDLRFAAPALALMSAYVYGLYAWLCGDLALRGSWDFIGHPAWPFWLLGLRDACIGLLFVAACVFLFRAVRGELVLWRAAPEPMDPS